MSIQEERAQIEQHNQRTLEAMKLWTGFADRVDREGTHTITPTEMEAVRAVAKVMSKQISGDEYIEAIHTHLKHYAS